MRPESTPARRSPGRTAILVFALALAMSAVAPGAAAQSAGIEGDLRLGVYTDVSEAFAGGGILVRLGESGWRLAPNLEYVFVDRGDLATINLDFLYDVLADDQVGFWLGAGAALVLRENHRGSSETDFGVNLFGGVGFLRQAVVRPYLQAKLLLSDETEGVIAFGIHF